MIATEGNQLRTLGERSIIPLLYGLFFWRLLKSKPEKRLEECGFLTLIVFAAVVVVGNPGDVPQWLFGAWITLVILHCFATLYFLFQRVFRASAARNPKLPRAR
jgi:hypothetical protein